MRLCVHVALAKKKVNTSCHYTEKLQLLWGDSHLEFLGTDEASIEERAGMTKFNLSGTLENYP